MSEVAVTYTGPGGAYHAADEDGTWHEFTCGATLTVSEDFAEELLGVEGHNFELADDVEVTTDQDGETDEALTTDQITDEGDPEGVNGASSYLEE